MRFLLTTKIFVSLCFFSGASLAISDAEIAAQGCNGCHGPNGVSRGTSIPSLAGLNSRYFMRTMLRFRKRERASSIMDRIAKGYKISDLRKISDYYSALEWKNASGNFDIEKVAEGRQIHNELCKECHEDNGRFQDKEIPRISGQTTNYLYMQLIDYYKAPPDMPQPEKMKEQLKTLSTEELDALSQFYSSNGKPG